MYDKRSGGIHRICAQLLGRRIPAQCADWAVIRKPYVALMDGIVMGGRNWASPVTPAIASSTDRSELAMPEDWDRAHFPTSGEPGCSPTRQGTVGVYFGLVGRAQCAAPGQCFGWVSPIPSCQAAKLADLAAAAGRLFRQLPDRTIADFAMSPPPSDLACFWRPAIDTHSASTRSRRSAGAPGCHGG